MNEMMVHLHLQSKYKSLEPFQSDVADFTVLTGLNGSGKTQILNAIKENSIKISNDKGELLGQIRYVPLQGLLPNGNDTRIIATEVVNIDAALSFLKDNLHIYLKKRETEGDISFYEALNNNHIGTATRQEYIKNINAVNAVAKQAKKKVEELDRDDFIKYKPLGSTTDDIFHQSLSILFKSYQNMLEENNYREYRHNAYGDSAPFLSQDDFVISYGEAPWETLNRIIAEAKLDYVVNSPSGISRDTPFQVELTNTISGVKVGFEGLSSGEKVLMSLVFALYNANYDIKFPSVLLMDEPDAYLHPSMIKQFIDIIRNIFVKEKGVLVIIATHSPSTVALVPEESIYIINKNEPRVEKSSKDKALRALVSGVPSFSVNYENRRQVFVESPYDVEYYEALYNIFSDHLNPEISLSFISSGDTRTDTNGIPIANCGQVIAITNLLREKGNKFAWGLIDWDLVNKDSDYVQVLGGGNRYNIENYIFDPILVSALLWKRAFVTAEELGLSKGEKYINILNLDESKIQILANFVVNKLAHSLKKDIGSVKKSKLVNGFEISLPIWFLEYQGHRLEDEILVVFPELKAIKKRQEKVLKMAILNEVAYDLLGLIPLDLLETLGSMQRI